MVKTVHNQNSFSVSITAFDGNGDIAFDKQMNDLTFMQAGDFFESGIRYFRFAIDDHSTWYSVQIEVNSIMMGLIEAIEITRD